MNKTEEEGSPGKDEAYHNFFVSFWAHTRQGDLGAKESTILLFAYHKGVSANHFRTRVFF